MLAAAEENPSIPTAMHLDHGDTLDSCKKAISLGFTSVMIDGSLEDDHKTPRSFESNLKITKQVVDYAHKYGVSVEGELGTIGGAEEDVQARHIILADPEQAKEFVESTGVDALAIAIGTSHGAYKFTQAPKLAIELVTKIRKLLPETALVMHGSSSVPQELVDKINKYGGKMPNAKGVPMTEIKKAIKQGVNKINVDTDSRMAFTAAIREIFATKPEEFDPRKYLGQGREAIKQLLITKMKEFGTAGHAGDYKPISLEEMKKKYN
jgi:fructose-bisphosphate aldolase class II